MADRPIAEALPADLPEDWTEGQIIAPAGADVGLSEQHGYNYLMEMVNRAQQGVNAINEGFDSISGKRTCRVVVGTSTAGWTEADCDFLCDGTDDQVEIQAAFDSIKTGEVVLLDGHYEINGPIDKVGSLRGSGIDKTILGFHDGAFSDAAALETYGTIRDLTLRVWTDVSSDEEKTVLKTAGSHPRVTGVHFATSGRNITCISASGSGSSLFVSDCCFWIPSGSNNKIVSINGAFQQFMFVMNMIATGGTISVIGSEQGVGAPSVLIMGNGPSIYTDIYLDSISRDSIIANNCIQKLELYNSSKTTIAGRGVLITGNNFKSVHSDFTCITLGENTRYNFVAGNSFINATDGVQHSIRDLGTGNIVRFNSDDPGGGGGGTAGVSSFKGRTGTVYPQAGDYTADQVGAIPTGDVAAIQSLTQAQYDALAAKDPATLYLIQG